MQGPVQPAQRRGPEIVVRMGECGTDVAEGAEWPEVWQVEQGVLVDVGRMLEQWAVETVDGVLEQDGTVELEAERWQEVGTEAEVLQRRTCGSRRPQSTSRAMA